MRIRKIPWRFLLPGVIFPMSVMTWVEYYRSVRASDDSPAPWYWYGGPLSAWLNFPAFVYSAPAQPLVTFGIRLGRLWIQPRIVTFFLLVFVFWYWIGSRIESWAAPQTVRAGGERPSRVRHVLYAVGAALWILISVGTTYELAFMMHVSSWYSLRYLYSDRELLDLAQFLWSTILATYYCRRFARGLRAKMA